MINKATITNFQSHKKTVLPFSPGVNVIVGPTDAGKSAIFRALLWACFNRPLGDAMRSHWSGKEATEVRLDLTDGKVIRRVKSHNSNEYWLDDTVLKAFRSDPPDEILKAHGLDRILNIQSQIDPFFLLQSSPGEVATFLNQVAGLYEIDRTTKILQAHHRGVQQKISQQEETCEKLKTSIEQYDDLEQIKTEVEKAEYLEAWIEKTRRRFFRVRHLVKQVTETKNKIKEAETKLQAKPLVFEAIKKQEELRALTDQRTRISRIVYGIGRIEQQLETNQERLKSVRPVYDKARKLHKDMDSLNQTVARGWKAIHAAKKAQERLKSTKADLAQLKAKWHESMPEGSTCPLCGREIGESV